MNLIDRINEFIEKQTKVYIFPWEPAPKGVQLFVGPRGGRYYIAGRSERRPSKIITGDKKIKQKLVETRKRPSEKVKEPFSEKFLNKYSNIIDSEENEKELENISQSLRNIAIDRLSKLGVKNRDVKNVSEALATYMTGYASTPYPDLGVQAYFLKNRGNIGEKMVVTELKKLTRELIGNKPIKLYRGLYHVEDDEFDDYSYNYREQNIGKKCVVPTNVVGSWTSNYKNAVDFANLDGQGIVISNIFSPEEILVNTSFIPEKNPKFDWQDQREFIISSPKKTRSVTLEKVCANRRMW